MEIVYYQCSFANENSIHTLPKDTDEEQKRILQQLCPYQINPDTIDTQKYGRMGRFLNADVLLLMRNEQQWHLLCIDLSIFSVTSEKNLHDPNSIQNIRKVLLHDLSYMRSKSVFTNLSIDTSEGTSGFKFSQGLKTYFTAFKYKDKETAKLIQAGSYAYDFYELFKDKGLLNEQDPITFHVIGYSDRNVSAMTVTQKDLRILQTCADIYRYDAGDQDMDTLRYEVLDTIRENATYSFQQGEQFVSNIANIAKNDDGIHWVPVHKEVIDNFIGTRDPLPTEQISTEVLRRLTLPADEKLKLIDAHQQLVLLELDQRSKNIFLFLTGNPGIGKTTAITKFLQEHQEEGFFLFYVSPRKQVNLDIVDKFRDAQGQLMDQTFALTSHSIAIKDNQGNPTVHYYSPHYTENFTKQGIKRRVDFLNAEQIENQPYKKSPPRLEQLSEQRVWDKGKETFGVLNSICNALYVTLRDDLSRQIIATVAIQSLRQTGNGRSTLEHLEKIFHSAFNSKTQKVIPEAMETIAGKIKHLFFMVDEVTGDESGVAFLTGLNRFINKYELTKYGFNTKIIVADASIVDQRVIERHLREDTYEPDKIYFKHVPSTEIAEPLMLKELEFQHKKAVMINANSYPAARLAITYNICADFFQYSDETILAVRDRLTDHVQQKIVADLHALLKQSAEAIPQIIVYIQNKRRLSRLKDEISNVFGAFEKNTHYIEIHASISEVEKRDIKEFKDKVRVVFMTASASRGLSFPRTTHILVDVPHFEVEQNLMEIIQVIYRGRGDAAMDVREKELHFYLSDRALYEDEENRELALRESILNILNVLLILKTAIMTRITGYGTIGHQQWMMIPVGGKSVLAAGETYTGELEQLIGDLRREHSRRPDHPWLKHLYSELRDLLGQADFELSTPRQEREYKKQPVQPTTTYLTMHQTFSKKFEDAVFNGFDRLLKWEPIELGYVSGGLLIVPFDNRMMQEKYLLQLDNKLRQTKNGDLWKKLCYVRDHDEYPPSLRSSVRNAIELIDTLNIASPEQTQQFTQDNRNPDHYYAIPLLTFAREEIMRDYFTAGKDEPEDWSFRALLASYVRTLYPVTTMLPIGDSYGKFPFVVFRSFNLEEVRHKIFSATHLFTSNELNVLNMLLSYKE